MRSNWKYPAVTALFGIVCSFGLMTDFAATLQEQLKSYYKTNLPVKLHLFHNQPGYIAGDTVFFKATFVTASGHNIIADKEIATVLLKDSRGITVSEQKAKLANGRGQGYLIIPSNCIPGMYSLIGYTSLMRNQNAKYYFRKSIPVSGPNRFETASRIEFFPEGGKLIEGVTNKLIVKAEPNQRGKIFTNDGSTVTEFTCDASGMDEIYIKPVAGLSYYFSHEHSKSLLARTVEPGINLLVSTEGERLKTIIQKTPGLKITGVCHLIVWHHDQILYAADMDFETKESHIIYFPKENIPDGVSGVTIFSHAGEVAAERLVYVRKEREAIVRMTTGKDEFAVRENVQLNISLSDPRHEGAEVAVSVYQADLFPQNGYHNNIVSYLNFYGDLSGGMHGPSISPGAEDALLVTQKWNRFDWNDVRSSVMWQESSLDNKITLTGKATDVEAGNPVPDSTLLLFFLENTVASYETRANAKGEFSFPLLLDFTGIEKIYYQAYHKGNRLYNCRITLKDHSETALPLLSTKETKSDDPYFNFCKDRKEISNVFNADATVPRKQMIRHEHPIVTLLGGPDITVNLKDYLLFPTMKETVHEIIPALKVRTGKKGSLARMIISDLAKEAKEDPLYIIDGILTDKTDYFLSLRPKDVVSIKLINTNIKLLQAGMAQNGVVIVETSIAENKRNVPPPVSSLVVSGFDVKKKFTTYSRPFQKQRLPDLRCNLFWNPQVKVGAGKESVISFQTPDNPGTYRIVIDGLTQTGEPIHEETLIKVSFIK